MKHQFQYFFNKDFSSYEDFLNKVLFPIFGENNFVQGYDVLTSRSDIKQKASEANIEEIKHVGTFSTDLAADIKLFEVVLADKSQIERSRTNIQMLIRRYVDTFEGAFMVFRYKNPVNRSWRFSYVEKRTSAADSTSAKRYTYLFGKDYACRTASQRFFELYSLQQSITLQNITDAFSVEALSNEFFHRYRTIYADFIQSINGKRYEKERGKWVENIKHDPDTQFFDVFEEDDKAVRDFVKKLLGRLVFLQFLQKKGWLAVPLNKTWGEGNTNFMQQLFRDSNNKENFLEAVLEPLFFDTLNSEREGHVANPILGVNIKIPYLNGGLFERDELDDKNVVFRYICSKDYSTSLANTILPLTKTTLPMPNSVLTPKCSVVFLKTCSKTTKTKARFIPQKKLCSICVSSPYYFISLQTMNHTKQTLKYSFYNTKPTIFPAV